VSADHPKPDGDVTRLPKWAQQYIETYRMRLDEATRREEKALAAAGFSQDGYWQRPTKLGQRVMFGPGERPPFMVHYRESDAMLEVHGHDSTLAVIPRAANSFYVRAVER
jgi:hypothetical protein